jgi:hypothetical protein
MIRPGSVLGEKVICVAVLVGGINMQLLAENMGTSVRMLEESYGKFTAASRRKLIEASVITLGLSAPTVAPMKSRKTRSVTHHRRMDRPSHADRRNRTALRALGPLLSCRHDPANFRTQGIAEWAKVMPMRTKTRDST